MPGFRPVGTRPVATVGAVAPTAQVFTPATGTFSFSGYAPLGVMFVPPVRVETVWIEVQSGGAPFANLDWMGLEVANSGAATARLSFIAVEAFNSGAAEAKLSWSAIEAVNDGDAYAEVSTVFIEVLRSIASVPQSGFHMLMAAF